MRIPPPGVSVAYMLLCADGSYYCGWTNDMQKRLDTHNAGHGAKYTKPRRPVRLCYCEVFETPQEAMSREWHLKRLTHEQKRALAEGASE